jgi:hypothetical protein
MCGSAWAMQNDFPRLARPLRVASSSQPAKALLELLERGGAQHEARLDLLPTGCDQFLAQFQCKMNQQRVRLPLIAIPVQGFQATASEFG